MNFFLFLNGQIIENFYESMRRDCITLDECGVFFLGHSKKCLVLIGGKVHEDGQGGEMFTLALGHFLEDFVKIDGCKHGDFFRGKDRPVVGATRGSRADREWLRKKC